MEFKSDWLQSKKRFEALWENEITDRCCIGVKGWRNRSSYSEQAKPEEFASQWLDGEYILKKELHKMEHTFYGGESFPMIWLNLGPGSHAASFKGVNHLLRNESIWFEPLSEDVGLNIEEDKNSFIEQMTYKMADYYVNQSNGRYFVSMPDNCGNLDALAHLRRSELLLVDLLLCPAEVNLALKKIQKAWERVINTTYNIIRNNNEGGSCVGWLDTWAPGLHAQMQVDISVMIDEQMYTEFALPELISQSDIIQYPLYHLDGQEQAKFIDQICSVEKLRMVQWTNVDGQPSPVQFIPEMKRIQQHGKGVLARVSTVAEAETIIRELSSKGLYVLIDTTLDSEREVKDVIRMAEKYTHE